MRLCYFMQLWCNISMEHKQRPYHDLHLLMLTRSQWKLTRIKNEEIKNNPRVSISF